MISRALDWFFPPQCPACEARVGTHGTLCTACWNGIAFLHDPLCAACGMPFEYALGEKALCGECIRELPPFAGARAVFRYDGASRSLVMKLKYHDQTLLAALFSPWLMRAGGELVRDSDVIVPVPLHYWRYVKRRYNQAALLARAVSAESCLPCVPDALLRIRATARQTGLTRQERHENVKRAFQVNPRHAAALKGKRVLLVDDVYTTGATLSACTKALLKGGAASVRALTLARRV